MSQLGPKNYAPDADLTLVMDFSLREIRFDIDVKIKISDETHDRVRDALLAGDKELAYGIVYNEAESQFDDTKPAHAVLQAAFGFLNVDKEIARHASDRARARMAEATR